MAHQDGSPDRAALPPARIADAAAEPGARCIRVVQAGPESVRVTAENFMEDRSAAPLDEDEIREALAAALTQNAPPALVRFVGKPAYSRYAKPVRSP